MTWINAFEGPCTVVVRRSGDIYWQGLLGKGESSPTFPGYFADTETLQISVSADGVVSLAQVAGADMADGYELSVVPGYDVTGASLRASGIAIASDASYAAAAWSNMGDKHALTPPVDWQHWVPTTVTPDPVDVTSGTASAICVSMGAGI